MVLPLPLTAARGTPEPFAQLALSSSTSTVRFPRCSAHPADTFTACRDILGRCGGLLMEQLETGTERRTRGKKLVQKWSFCA